MLAVSTRLSSHGKVEATLVAAGGLCGSVEPVPDAQEGVEPLSATVPLHGHQQPQCWGAAIGASCAGRHSPAPFSHPPYWGPLGSPGCWHRAGEGLWPHSPWGLLHGAVTRHFLGLLLWVPGVQLASSLWVAVGTDRPLISPAPAQGPGWGKQEEPVTNRWQKAHKLPVHKTASPPRAPPCHAGHRGLARCSLVGSPRVGTSVGRAGWQTPGWDGVFTDLWPFPPHGPAPPGHLQLPDTTSRAGGAGRGEAEPADCPEGLIAQSTLCPHGFAWSWSGWQSLASEYDFFVFFFCCKWGG